MKSYKKTYQDLRKEGSSNMVFDSSTRYLVRRCLYCYESLGDANENYHQKCNKNFFGQLYTPTLSYENKDLQELAAKVLHSQMAVTGVQAKVSLSLNRKEDRNQVKKMTIVGLYGDYILKPPSDFYPNLPELEDLTMHLAEVCGLNTVPHSLVYLADGTLCYLTKRVDRTKTGKLHMEDMCQLTERMTDDKYKGSHEQVAKTVMKYSANPVLDVSNFFELVVFCFLTGNSDMHLKNFSLLETANGDFTLSPAYDLVPTALVNKEDKEELALTLNGKKSKLNYRDFLAAYTTLGLSQKVLDKTLENFFYCSHEFYAIIEKSFLSDKLKDEYWQLMNARYTQLGL